ncbi:hypothetical protein BC628DRAFT_1409435 [Trametes gibbosa]|nr:hypothetical protein BC628DRAFT_1409435 [Trametes gibbosa]
MALERDDKRAQSLVDAQHALDGAMRLGRPSRAGELEKGAVDAINAAGKANESSDGMGILLDGVHSLVESLPPLVRALDTVAQIHPFLAIAVGAFKVVVELEAKRRDNDKKVNLLFLEMRNMMGALLQLQDVRAEHVAPDGLSIGARLADVVKKTADDIKTCANACDAYARKRLLVKVFKAPSWDGTLQEYIQLFSDRKGEFCFAIAVHTGVGLDRANDTLDVLVTKVDLILKFFEKTMSDEQRALAEVVRQAGGAQAVLANADVMRALLIKEQQFECPESPNPEYRAGVGVGWSRPVGGGLYFTRAAENQRARRRTRTGREGYEPRRGYAYAEDYYGAREDDYRETRRADESESALEQADPDLRRLMRDLADEPAVAIRRNLVSFERKFRIQQREIVHEMTRVVVHEGDRVINSVLAGPHERIVDPDMYEIWKDMRWRGIVKARHLALAIHDYYSQKLDDQRRAEAQKTAAPLRPIGQDDLWALECLDLMRLQRITEAFDSDVSGFVTVQEVNAFTTSRPKGWSLLHWLAYWAVGWQVAMAAYRRKIRALLARMRVPAFRASVRGRESAVQRYLEDIADPLGSMTRPFREEPERLFLAERFGAYVQQEEDRLREGLETARYDLDALDTLALVNGPRGLERNLFVILYLILRRHCDVMKVGRRVILHPDELADASAVVRLVKDAFDYRAADLVGLFTQRRLMVDLEVSDYASGMMAQTYGGPPINYGADEAAELVVVAVDDVNSSWTNDCTEAILKYPPHFEEFYPQNEDGIMNEGREVDEELQPLLGHWAGVQITEDNGIVHRRTFTFDFHPAPGDPSKVIAAPLLSAPWMCTRATVTGTFGGLDEKGRSTYALVDVYNTSALPDGHTRLTLGEDRTTFMGERDATLATDTPSSVRAHVVMKKESSPDIMQFYPQPSKLQANKAAALWRFAISATLHDVRRRHLSWGFLLERRGRKRRLASLLLAAASFELDGEEMDPDDRAERARLASETTPADWHFFAWAAIESNRVQEGFEDGEAVLALLRVRGGSEARRGGRTNSGRCSVRPREVCEAAPRVWGSLAGEDEDGGVGVKRVLEGERPGCEEAGEDGAARGSCCFG